MYWIIFIAVALVSYAVQASLQTKFAKYSKIRVMNGMTGAEVAQRMLADNGINDVKVLCVKGQLTDHYNPQTKIVNLSEDVYNTCSVAAAAVAAHECGHAVQHATGYVFLKMRSAMVPAVNLASRTLSIILLAGILLINIFPQIMLAGIILFALTTLFSFITLPVEINASKRAVQWLERAGITDVANHEYAVSALKSAAYTYVVAALSSLATLFYYIMIFTGGNRR